MSFRILPKTPSKMIWLSTPPADENLRACRGCLATNTKLFDLNGSIKNMFADLMGSPIPEPDILPKYLCSFCYVLVRKFKEFKEKCTRSQELLHNINNIKMLNTKFIKSVDRPYYNLNYNLTVSVPVFMETDFIKEEIDLVEEEPDKLIKQEDKEENENIDDAAPENAMEYEYIIQEEEYLEEEVKEKPQKSIQLEALEKEYNMDILELTKEEQVLQIEARRQSQNYLKSNHRCEDCGKGFNSNDTYLTHFNSLHHPSLGDFLCMLCKARFDTKTKLSNHVYHHQYRYNCRECPFTTMRRWSASKHRKWHCGLTFTCEICSKDFNMNTSYLSHMRIHHPPEDFWCRYCGESFVSELGLKAHTRLKHAVETAVEYVCQTCASVFANEQALTVHNSMECSINSCAQCGENFETTKDLKEHIITVHTEKLTVHTGKSTVHTGKSTVHTGKSTVHTAKSTVHKGKVKVKQRVSKKAVRSRKNMRKCDMCDNLFNNESALERHMELLGGSCGGMRACVHCGESFLTGDMLKEHVIENHSEVEMLCPRCNRTFESSDEFNEHYTRVHMKKGPPRLIGTKTWGVTVLENGPVIAEKPDHSLDETPQVNIKTKSKMPACFCEVCGKRCASNVHLTYHQRQHTGEKPYKCAICQKAFAVPKFLKEHFKVHTGERPFDCDLCTKAFKSKSALNRHKLCHTGERRHICQICSKDFLTSSDVKTHIKTVHMKIVGPPRRKPRIERPIADEYCIIEELT